MALFVEYYSDGSFYRAYYYDANGKKHTMSKKAAKKYMSSENLINHDYQSGMSAMYRMD